MDKEFKKILRRILKGGWRLLAPNKHNIVQHIASGRKVQFSMSPSDGHAHKQFERAIQRVEKEEMNKEMA